jgi:hypothetical protein
VPGNDGNFWYVKKEYWRVEIDAPNAFSKLNAKIKIEGIAFSI